MESLLKEKQRRGQNTSKGQKQYSRFSDPHVSHSHEAQEVLRSYNLQDCDFGKQVTTTLNSRNFIGAMWLVVDLGDADSGNNYCEHVGMKLVEDLTWRFAGRSFHKWDYDTVAYCTLQKYKDDQKKGEVLRLAGGAAKLNPGKVIVPLYNYFSPYNKEDIQQGPCWTNGASNARLELEIKFRAKAELSTGHASATMDSVTLYYQEILVGPAIENSFRNRDRLRPRIEYNQISDVSFAAGVQKEVDISSLVSGGNIRQLIIKSDVGAAATLQPFATARPTTSMLKINGVELFDEAEPILSQWMLLHGYDLDENEDQPYCIPFCQNPQGRDSSGYLPSSNDKATLHLTFAGDQTIQIFAEYEKIFKVVNNGRIEKTDS